MLDKNKNQTLSKRMTDASNLISIYFGLSFFNISFYHPIYIIPETIIGFTFFVYGLVSVSNWKNGNVNRINYIKWSVFSIILFVFPLQIYSFIIKRNLIDSTILFIIVILNIVADAIVVLILTRKEKDLKNEHQIKDICPPKTGLDKPDELL